MFQAISRKGCCFALPKSEAPQNGVTSTVNKFLFYKQKQANIQIFKASKMADIKRGHFFKRTSIL